MSHFLSPLRYPGGKRKLANFIKLVTRSNDLIGGLYVEPYAGGAAIALSQLFSEHSSRILINDLDRSIHAFWSCVVECPDDLCGRIRDAEISIDEWERQREVQDMETPSTIDLAFSTFYLNRTNRSGIINGGVIGGKDQSGRWKIGARFNKDDLIQRIRRISRYKSRIEVRNLDALDLIQAIRTDFDSRTLLYLDPPYFVKGGDLYENHYSVSDHNAIAKVISSIESPWIVTYDAVGPIEELYEWSSSMKYGISYSAQDRYEGSEVMFYSEGLVLPDVPDPARINKAEYIRLDEELVAAS